VQRHQNRRSLFDFDDEGTVDDWREAVQRGVAAIAVHDEQFTAGTIFPAEPRVRAERVAARTVLSEHAHKHARRNQNNERTYDFSNLYTYSRLGEKVTRRVGSHGQYLTSRSFSESNFGGTFTFSSLDSYLAGRPLMYRVTRGNPLLETDQLQRKKRDTHNLQRQRFDSFPALNVGVQRQPPQQGYPRRNLNDGIKSKSDKYDAACNDARTNGYDSLQAVPSNREQLQPFAGSNRRCT
jgi:hypothetical protein